MKRSVLFISTLYLAGFFSSARLSIADTVASAQEENPQATSSEGQPMTSRQIAEMRADVLAARKEYGAAVDAYLEIAKKEPKNAVVLNKVGLAYQSLGENELAERYYKKAAKADPKFGIALNNLGTLEYSQHRFGRAIKDYNKAFGHVPSEATVYSNLGYAYSANNEYPKALDAFSKALTLDPDVFAHHGGAGALVAQRSSEDPATLYFLLAKAFAEKGDVDHTVQYLKLARDSGYKKMAAVKQDPSFAMVIKNPRVLEVVDTQSPLVTGKNPPVSN